MHTNNSDYWEIMGDAIEEVKAQDEYMADMETNPYSGHAPTDAEIEQMFVEYSAGA